MQIIAGGYKLDSDSLLDDFISEARTHLEKIESAFLDAEALANAPDRMDGVFRAAHSLKGTAGFFSLDKIVAVAHELESVFSRIKNGNLALNDEVADAALQSVDVLKALLDHIHSPDEVDTGHLLDVLRNYSAANAKKNKGSAGAEIRVPFDLKKPETEKILQSAAKRGHKAYYLNIHFDRSLGKYYSYPKGLMEDILSIGSIVEAAVDGAAADASDPAGLVEKMEGSAGRGSSDLELLVTSVLEPELFRIAVEVDNRFIHPISPISTISPALKDPARASEQKNGVPIQAADFCVSNFSVSKDLSAPKDSSTPKDPSTPKNFSASKDVPVPKDSPARKSDLPKSDFSIRLDISVVNGLMDLANEMILTRNRLLSSTSAHRKSIAGLTPVLHDMSRLTSEIQEKVMRTRMQPVSVLFGKFPRMIRDTAKSLHKDIQIEILGGGVALDKYLLDSLSDPITQLVKNSADHGIENAERRAALGKPQKGLITLKASLRDGAALIEVSDDGAGIDTEALKRKGLERGAVSEEQLAAMTKSDLLALIFEPGLSTAKQVTNVSGRGVGMDIVKTNIEKLGGSVEIESEPDRGTTLRLKMPLTLSVVRTLIVTICSVPYAVPESSVERIVRVSPASYSKRFEQINNSLALNLNGWILPVVTLEGIDAKAKGLMHPPSAQELLERARRRDGTGTVTVIKCLVLRVGRKHFALLIDDAVETEETLIKPLPIYLRNCRCYSSMTVLGNGRAIMILDAEGILRFMEIEGVEKNADADAVRKDGPSENLRQVIVFKCSGAEYFALDADRVCRIERIDPERIQEIGGGRFINVAGKTVQVLRPEDYAPVQKRAYDKSRLYLLMLNAGAPDAKPGTAVPDTAALNTAAPNTAAPNTAAPAVGILAGRVLDKAEGAFPLDGGVLESDYVFGTSAYNEKILIFLNSAEMVRSAGRERQFGKERRCG